MSMTSQAHTVQLKPVEGKTKILAPGEKAGEWLATFKDDATAFNAEKHAVIPGKGKLNARISALLFRQLESAFLPTCFIREGDAENILVYRPLKMIPLEVVVRNVALGSVVKRFGLQEGQAFSRPVIEFFYKSDTDPLISESLILELGLVDNEKQLADIRRLALSANEIFCEVFSDAGITCADFKLEFGLNDAGEVVIGDELSPDNFRLRDISTGAVLDKDVFRLDLGDVSETYTLLLDRLEGRSIEVGAPQTSLRAAHQPRTYRAEIFVQSRKAILNPESRTILETIHAMGYSDPDADVTQLRAGKYFTLELHAASLSKAERLARRLSEDVLSNPVIEDYDLRVDL
jgi:phosphoribosylaminoimidazole-succinocarboxamide synthase